MSKKAKKQVSPTPAKAPDREIVQHTYHLSPDHFTQNGRVPSRVFSYLDATGLPVAATARFEAGVLKPQKSFFFYSYDPKSPEANELGYALKLSTLRVADLPLYRLPAVVASLKEDPTQPVFLVEGEKCADALAERGLIATTRAGGCQAAIQMDVLEPLRGANVIFICDSDAPGRRYAEKMKAALRDIASFAEIIDLALDRSDGFDVADWLQEGHDAVDLRGILEAKRREIEAAGGENGNDSETKGEVAFNTSARNSSNYAGSRVGSAEAKKLKLPVPPFEALPAPMGDYFRSIADSFCCDPSTPFALGVGIVSACIGRAVDLVMRPGWGGEPLGLWIAVVGPPGSVKSPVFKELLKPLSLRNRELAVRHKEEVSKWEEDVRAYERALAKGETTTDSEEGAVPLVKPGPRPQQSQVVASDTTIEALVDVLSASPRLLIGHDELSALFNAMGCYKPRGGHDRQAWLSLHTGSQIIVNRKGKDAVIIESPSIAVVGCTTPKACEKMVWTDADDGLIDRFFFVQAGHAERKWAVPGIPHELADSHNARIKDLLRLQCPPPGMPLRKLVLSAKASAIYGEWYEQNSPSGNPESIGGILSKLSGHIGRIAATLQLYKDPESLEINEAIMQSAITVGQFFAEHTLILRGSLSKSKLSPVEEAVKRRVLDLARKHNGVSVRDVLQARIPRLGKSEDVRAIVKDLERENRARIVTKEGPSGRKVERLVAL